MRKNWYNPEIKEFTNKSLAYYFAVLLVFGSFVGNAQTRYQKICMDGFSSEDRGDLDQAIKYYSDAIVLKPATYDAYGQRANAYFKSERYEDAVADATKAISLNPGSVVLYHLRGNCYLETNSFDNAIADYSFAISNGKDHNYTGIYPAVENKQNCHLYFKRAKALYYNKQYLFAINDLSRAINLATQLKVQTDYMYYWRGRCNVELENFKEAVKDLEISISGFPQDVNMNYYLGLSYFKSENIEKAKQYALKLIDLDQSNEKYFFRR